MTQNNLYMEDDNMRLYVDVQPLFIDELENSKNSAAASAASAAQSEANARTWKNDIIDYKTSLELFYAQARDGITNSYNNSVSDLTSVRNLAYDDLNSQKNSIRTSLNNSLNSALTSISTNGQNYVNQAREYAEQAQNTVDNRVSKDLLIQSNAFKAGSVSTNMDVLAEVNNYAHSTFDKSKFTVVGSPNITDDGIASGFSGSKYLYYSNSIGTNYNTFEIDLEFSLITRSTSANNDYICGSLGWSSADRTINIFSSRVNNKFGFTVGKGTEGLIGSVTGTGNTVNLNTKYYLKFKFTGSKYILSYSLDNKNFIDEAELSSTEKAIFPSSFSLGKVWNEGQDCVYDLKQFSITVDGVEVFSGNKTGIDTIKPDDYQVVGAPTISADGIASGFTDNNYLKYNDISQYIPAGSTNFEIEFPIYMSSTPTHANCVFATSRSGAPNYYTYGFVAELNTSGNLVLRIGDGTGHQILHIAGSSYPTGAITTNKLYIAKVVADGVNYYTYLNDVLAETVSISKTIGYKTNDKSLTIGRILDTSGVNYEGLFDLNAFKIYVDGDLVYQPCLKIPYTESKTGSKIVNSIYRDRVNDMAEQFGYANYYTLDEDNGNFTLPQVELYGLIGQRTLRDSYRNGINYWELYSNRDLEQGGSCTSGVEVTFARPFADTNYVLSVPYSAKSSTAFTPTQTGDWIAKGKGLL